MILITGSSGTIGQPLVNSLLKNGIKPEHLVLTYRNNKHLKLLSRTSSINFIECDLTNEYQIKNIFRSYNINSIIHLAAAASARSKSINEFYDLNLKGTHYLLEQCNINTNFIFASSLLYYGNSGAFYETDRPNPQSLYAITKVACEQLIDKYYRDGKIRPRILRLCPVVGPVLNHGRIKEAISGVKSIDLFGKPPGDYFPVIHIDDVCRVVKRILTYNKPKGLWNVAPDDYISLQDCLLFLKQDLQLNWSGNKEPEILQCYNDKIRIDLNVEMEYNSIEAIQRLRKDLQKPENTNWCILEKECQI